MTRPWTRSSSASKTDDAGYYPEIATAPSFNEERARGRPRSRARTSANGTTPQEEAEAALDARVQELREAQEEARRRRSAQRGARLRRLRRGATNKARQELEGDRDAAADRVQFAEYVEPGAVAGSYREVFLTVPQVRAEATVPQLTGLTGEELYELHLNGWDVALDADRAELGRRPDE